jgi:hypothetical protein
MGDAQAWYKSLPATSIDRWESFKRKFTEKWGYKKDNSFFLAESTSICKNENKTVSEFKGDIIIMWYNLLVKMFII